MTLFAGCAMVEMRLVAEGDQGLQLIDPYPGNRRLRLCVAGELLNRGPIGGDGLVALRTDWRVWGAECLAGWRWRVAGLAPQTHRSRVKLVA